MSAKKARFIRRIFDAGATVGVNLKLESGEYADVGIHELSRVELIRGCAMLGIKSGGTWTTWSNDDMVVAIEDAVLKNGKRHDFRNTRGIKGEAQGGGEGGGTGTGEGNDGDGNDGDRPGDGDGQPDGQQGEGEGQPEGQGDDDTGDQPAESDGNDGEATGEVDPLLARLAEFIDARIEAHDGGGNVDTDEVRAMIEEAVSQLKPHVSQIKLPNGEIRNVPGRQHEQFELLLKCISMRLNMYLVGPPGTGKSYSTEQAAEALGLEYASLSLGPQTPESRLWGYHDATGNYVRTPYRDAYEFGKVFCLDELDNGHPGIIASMNQSIAGSGCTFPDGWVDKHPNFVLVSTANTFGTGPTAEFVGRNILDPATLDRFTTLEWDIDVKVEADMVAARLDDKQLATKWHRTLKAIRKNSAKYRIKVVCSPRAASDGAALLSLGLDVRTALDMRVFRGLSEEQTRKLLDGVEV